MAARAAVERGGVSPEEIDHVIFGNAQQTSSDAIYLARHIGLGAILLTLLPDLMRGFDEWRMAAYGIILVAMVTLRPQGILTRCTLAYAQHP